MSRSLPDFDSPPVIETTLGVEFAPIEKLSVLHLGLFWHQLRDEYPEYSVQPPLSSQIEKFGKESIQSFSPTFEIITEPNIRIWFIESTKNRLLQVQRDRFIQNWRKLAGIEPYPHYENLRPTFESEWFRFCSFLNAEGLGQPEIRQCEVTYVNHVERGAAWDSVADLPKILRCWTGATGKEFLPDPENINLRFSYQMPDRVGRLSINVQQVVRHSDTEEVLQLTLTARGRPKTSSSDDMMSWLDLGREHVVRGFADITTPEMHKLWGRRS